MVPKPGVYQKDTNVKMALWPPCQPLLTLLQLSYFEGGGLVTPYPFGLNGVQAVRHQRSLEVAGAVFKCKLLADYYGNTGCGVFKPGVQN